MRVKRCVHTFIKSCYNYLQTVNFEIHQILLKDNDSAARLNSEIRETCEAYCLESGMLQQRNKKKVAISA